MFEGLKEFTELGSTVVVVLAFILYLGLEQRKKKTSPTQNESILKQVELMNVNHLTHIESAIKDGNADIVRSINEGNIRIVEKLGEICGKLSR